MRSLKALVPFSLLLSLCIARLTTAQSPILLPDSELILISDGFKFTEGPAADSNGDVLFTDQPNDQIVKYSFHTGEVSTWLKPAGRSNGLYYASEKSLIACADHQNELWEIDTLSKEHRVITKNFGDRRFSGPNDCWVDQDGSIYFTDPLYRRPYWTQSFSDDHPRGVYRVDTEDKVRQVANDLKQPNGIIGNTEKRLLYIADINAGKTFRYRIREDGTLSEKTLFCESGSDGMTIDQEGNVYLTGRGVSAYNPDGKKIMHLPVPRGWTANVTFAGPERRHLFVTAGDSVFVIKTQMRGR